MSSKIKDLHFYKYQDNQINHSFMKIYDTYFRIDEISTISGVNTHYESNRYTKNDSKPIIKKGEFKFVCDGKEYRVIAEKEMTQKIYDSLIKWTFPNKEEKEKVFI